MIYLSNAYLATCVSLPFSYSICTRIYSTFCTTEIQLSTFYISTAFYKYVRDKAAAAAAPRTATQVQLLVARRALPGVCCCSRLTAHGSRLTAHGSRLTAHGSRLTTHGSPCRVQTILARRDPSRCRHRGANIHGRVCQRDSIIKLRASILYHQLGSKVQPRFPHYFLYYTISRCAPRVFGSVPSEKHIRYSTFYAFRKSLYIYMKILLEAQLHNRFGCPYEIVE